MRKKLMFKLFSRLAAFVWLLREDYLLTFQNWLDTVAGSFDAMNY